MSKRVKLAEKDKKTINNSLKICTESHGSNCSGQHKNEKEKTN